MNTWKKLGAAVLTAGAAVAFAAQGTAGADEVTNPTYINAPFGYVGTARASDVTAVGLLNLGPLADAKCTPGQSRNASVLSVNVPGIATVNGVQATCSVNRSGAVAHAQADVASVNLFNGRIKITALRANCDRYATFGFTPIFHAPGTATVGATYGSLVTDQNYSKNGSGAIVIPNLATVAVNVKDIGAGRAYADLIVVTLFNTGQVVVISACSLVQQNLD